MNGFRGTPLKSPLFAPSARVPIGIDPGRNRGLCSRMRFSGDKIQKTLKESDGPLTWTEIRTIAKLPEKFPNNKWVRRMEADIALKRKKDSHGIIKWRIE